MLRTSRGTVILLLSAVFVTFGLLQLSTSSLALVYTGVGLFLFYYVSRLILQIIESNDGALESHFAWVLFADLVARSRSLSRWLFSLLPTLSDVCSQLLMERQ